MGFTKKESKLYTNSLMIGATKLIERYDSLDLLKSIASKGGTTEAALFQLKKDKVDKNVSKAIQASLQEIKKNTRKIMSGLSPIIYLILSIMQFIILLRFICQAMGVNYYNPVTQSIVKISGYIMKAI